MSFELDISTVLGLALVAPVLFLLVLIFGLSYLHKTTGEPLQQIANALARVVEARLIPSAGLRGGRSRRDQNGRDPGR